MRIPDSWGEGAFCVRSYLLLLRAVAVSGFHAFDIRCAGTAVQYAANEFLRCVLTWICAVSLNSG